MAKKPRFGNTSEEIDRNLQRLVWSKFGTRGLQPGAAALRNPLEPNLSALLSFGNVFPRGELEKRAAAYVARQLEAVGAAPPAPADHEAAPAVESYGAQVGRLREQERELRAQLTGGPCPACGKRRSFGARLCQHCAAPWPAGSYGDHKSRR